MGGQIAEQFNLENGVIVDGAKHQHLAWDRPNPCVLEVTVQECHIDVMSHTNNVVYLRWMEHAAIQHGTALGGGWELWDEMGYGLVARRHEIDYLGATTLGDELAMATWVTLNDGRLYVEREFQLINVRTEHTVLRGRTRWASIKLDSGRPCRMPEKFKTIYVLTE